MVNDNLDKSIDISVLIPTLNAGEAWIDLLEGINRQSIPIARKIIIDSGSHDDTVAEALKYDFEVITIPVSEFNHGRVRQQLADLSGNSNICIFLTQDAILTSAQSLEKLVAAFADPAVGMAYGRQLPHKNATALEAHARLFNYPATSEVLSMADIKRKGFKVFFCSNSFAAYRKTALQSIGGFPTDAIMGEDAIVAAKMLEAGFKKAYVADAVVYHSHNYRVVEEFKRYFDTRVFHEQHQWLIERYGRPTGEGIRFIKSELRYALKNDVRSILKSVISTGAKWLGYKSGKYYRKISTPVLKKISMHKFHWK